MTGKKSIQTVQDAYMYGLSPLYGLLPKLKVNFYLQNLSIWESSGFINFNQDDIVSITDVGIEWLEEHEYLSIEDFNGMDFHQRDEQFMMRLLLFIQILTNSKMNNYDFIPIAEDKQYTSWARAMYHQKKGKLNETLDQLEKELSAILKLFSNYEANIFVDRLTGYKSYGKSIYQLADNYNASPIDTQLILTKIIHKMMKQVYKHPELYILLTNVIPELIDQKLLTSSAKKTDELFRRGYSLKRIAQIRNLRLNTIKDHIAEISLFDPSFPYDDFLTNDVQKQIYKVVDNLETFKLKQIKEHIDHEITYFEIRLALSKYTQDNGDYL